jgi:hypothetical protein
MATQEGSTTVPGAVEVPVTPSPVIEPTPAPPAPVVEPTPVVESPAEIAPVEPEPLPPVIEPSLGEVLLDGGFEIPCTNATQVNEEFESNAHSWLTIENTDPDNSFFSRKHNSSYTVRVAISQIVGIKVYTS